MYIPPKTVARPAVPTQAPPAKPVMSDVALGPQGKLTGRIVDGAGAPKPGVELTIYHEQQTVGKTLADKNGDFAFSGLQGGVHQVKTADGTFACRFWAPDTAPPTAKPEVVFVDDPNVGPANYTGEVYEGVGGGKAGGCNSGCCPADGCDQPSCEPCCNRRKYCFLKRPFGLCWNNPLLIGGIVATAIAVPVAISNHDRQSGS